jgi:tripartite-type tricarboxylate transporter receptor subunit TctC
VFDTLPRTLAVLACGALSAVALAQETAGSWPSKPVTVVVPLSPGAAVDIETRLYAQKLAQNTGRSFVVDYKPGAGTTIGLGHVVKSAPDGHTLVAITASATIAKLAYPNLPFDPSTDLALVCLMTYRPTLLLANPTTPFKSVKDVIAYAKAHPAKLNAGTSGAGSLGELSWGLFSRLAGVKLTLVHYKGGAPANIALVSGEVDLIWGGFASSMPYIRAGKARVLGISTAERSRLLPDVPTVAEQGAPGFTYLQWIGIAVPAATPSAIVARLNEELVKVARDADILRRLHDDGTVAVASTPERFREQFREESARWRKVAAETGVRFTQ